jgi:hypothetical protein
MSNVNENEANKPCPHCVIIRTTAEHWIAALHSVGWPMKDVAQLCAYIHARIRFYGLKQEGEATANEFLDFFNKMCDIEFQELHHANPLEPKSFDETYDFRQQMKNGE